MQTSILPHLTFQRPSLRPAVAVTASIRPSSATVAGRLSSPGRKALLGTKAAHWLGRGLIKDRKSTRLKSHHGYNSYAVFCFEKKKKKTNTVTYSIRKP